MSDDLIRRQDVIDALWKIKDERDSVYYTSAIYTAVETIKQLSSAPSEQKHGKWIAGREIAREMLCDKTICVFYENYKCSECGLILDRLLFNVDGTPFYKYCPNCGAKMIDNIN